MAFYNKVFMLFDTTGGLPCHEELNIQHHCFIMPTFSQLNHIFSRKQSHGILVGALHKLTSSNAVFIFSYLKAMIYQLKNAPNKFLPDMPKCMENSHHTNRQCPLVACPDQGLRASSL